MKRQSFRSFVWELATPFWRTLASAFDGASTRIAALLLLLFLVYRPLGLRVASWDGVSPWFALLPAGYYFSYSLLRRAHGAYWNSRGALESKQETLSLQLEECRRSVGEQARALTEEIVRLTTKKAVDQKWAAQLEKLKDFSRAIDHLLSHAPSRTTYRRFDALRYLGELSEDPVPVAALPVDWSATVAELISSIAHFRHNGVMSALARAQFDHPPHESSRPSAADATEDFKLVWTKLCRVECSVLAAIDVLAREQEESKG